MEEAPKQGSEIKGDLEDDADMEGENTVLEPGPSKPNGIRSGDARGATPERTIVGKRDPSTPLREQHGEAEERDVVKRPRMSGEQGIDPRQNVLDDAFEGRMIPLASKMFLLGLARCTFPLAVALLLPLLVQETTAPARRQPRRTMKVTCTWTASIGNLCLSWFLMLLCPKVVIQVGPLGHADVRVRSQAITWICSRGMILTRAPTAAGHLRMLLPRNMLS